jgi:hypothetical protein
MFARSTIQPIQFLSLSTAVFCVQCELISANNTTCCRACGSKAVLSLSRLLGGSLRGQDTARVIHDDELNRLVRDLLQTVPAGELDVDLPLEQVPAREPHVPSADELLHSEPSTKIGLEPAIGVIAERAQVLTGATGAALALRNGAEVICRARAGRTAPDLGVRLQTDSGISAECLRTGEVVLCNDAEDNPHADRVTCERLGVRSILAAPLRQFRNTLGIFEVLSGVPNAFNHQDVATMQLLSSMMVTAITRLSRVSPRSIWRR